MGEEASARTCRDAVDLLVDYLDGTLDPDQRVHLEAHFRGCVPCLKFLSSYRKTVALTRTLTEEQVPTDVLERVQRFLRDREGP